MSTDIYTKFADAASAHAELSSARRSLELAESAFRGATSGLRDAILDVRRARVLTVNEVAEAIGRKRSYVDNVWHVHGGEFYPGDPATSTDEIARDRSRAALTDAADAQVTAMNELSSARDHRDRLVATTYASKVLGPSRIAETAGIDRNHVLRLARRAGIGPMHRTNIANQYTVDDNE